MSTPTRHGPWLTLIPMLALTSGCASNEYFKHTISIDSDPRGATVLADDKAVGTTPLTVVPDEVFPPKWTKFSYRAVGTLTIERSGCAPYTTEVDDYVLSKDIHVTLDCTAAAASEPEPTAQEAPTATEARATTAPAVVEPEPEPAQAPPATTQAQGDAVAERLQRVEALREQGVITEDEYRQIRQRILNEL